MHQKKDQMWDSMKIGREGAFISAHWLRMRCRILWMNSMSNFTTVLIFNAGFILKGSSQMEITDSKSFSTLDKSWEQEYYQSLN